MTYQVKFFAGQNSGMREIDASTAKEAYEIVYDLLYQNFYLEFEWMDGSKTVYLRTAFIDSFIITKA